MYKSTLTAIALATTLTASSVFAEAHAVQANIHTITVDGGKIYTDSKGMSLYTFDKDTKGTSNCNDGCAVKWPPLMAVDAAKGEGQFSVITRADGTHQWAVDGMALYTWFKDKKSGDMTGDGVKGVWHIAKP